MDETLRRVDELALELKLLTTEMRERGPRVSLLYRAQLKLDGLQAALNTTAAQGD
jgi:hypothetical protein